MLIGRGDSSQFQGAGATSAHKAAEPAASNIEPARSGPGLRDPNRCQAAPDLTVTNITTTSATTTTFTTTHAAFDRNPASDGARVPDAPELKARGDSPERETARVEAVKARASPSPNSGRQPGAELDASARLDSMPATAFNTSPASLWIAEAQVRMGNCLAHSRIGAGANAKQARKWWRQAARQGNREAQLALASSYLVSNDVPDRLTKAAKWLGRAARGGDPESMARYGEMLARGEGMARDDAAALDWFQRAADHGDAGGLFWLGVFHQVGRGGLVADARQAYTNYRQAGRKKHAQAQFARAYMLWHGIGTGRNLPKSVRTYIKAAMQGVPEAMWRLGICFEHGIYVSRDIPIAVNAFRMAAANQDPDAMFHLARCQYRGIGVDKNRSAAVEWLAASRSYAHLILRNEHGAIDSAQALRLLEHAVETYEQRLVDRMVAIGAAFYRDTSTPEEVESGPAAPVQGGAEANEAKEATEATEAAEANEATEAAEATEAQDSGDSPDSPDSNDSPESPESTDSQESNDSPEPADRESLAGIPELPEPRSPHSSDSSAADGDQAPRTDEPLGLEGEGGEAPQSYG